MTNVVLISPRRYGKTSLVKRVQHILEKKDVLTLYVDFFGVSSVDSVAFRLASRVFQAFYENERLTKKLLRFLTSWRPVIKPDPEYGLSVSVELAAGKRGIALLEETLEGLGKFIGALKGGCNIVFDEFQEIVELKESLEIEGIMRSHIQTHSNASYFFVGSRRRLLSDIFNQKKRPFYRSAINYTLKPLSTDEATSFIVRQFKKGGKLCSEDIAMRIVERVNGYPYYVQRIPYSIYEISGAVVKEDDYIEGLKKTIEEEKLVYEAMLKALAPQQIALLSAIAVEPTKSPFSTPYMSKHNLGSIGGVQSAIKRLIELDYIEIEDKVHRVVDPVFGIWLRRLI